MIIIKIVCLGLFLACQSSTENAEDVETDINAMPKIQDRNNSLTEGEINDGWQLLFDGNSPEGWRQYKGEDFPDDWEVADGTLHCKGGPGGHDLIYEQEFSNFHLKIDWKISEGGNSGLFYLGQETDGPIYGTAPEMQILDNERHPDAKMGKDGNRKAGSLYDLIPASPQNANPAEEWNHFEVKIVDREVWHFMNGEEVVHYQIDTKEWQELVADSKFPGINPDWVKVPEEGYIGLQNHDDEVWFKNIKLKVL